MENNQNKHFPNHPINIGPMIPPPAEEGVDPQEISLSRQHEMKR